MTQTSWSEDPVLRPLIEAAAADPETIGLILYGSRGAGYGGPESDYDVAWVLTDVAHEGRKARGETTLSAEKFGIQGVKVDLWYDYPTELARQAANPSWGTYDYSCASVLMDKTGEVKVALDAFARVPEEKAKAELPLVFDGYLNAFFRSMKAWRRGNELGGRLHAAVAANQLVQMLYMLERRWGPYLDRLDHAQLGTLAFQGWPPGYLYDTLLALIRTGDPTLQQELEVRVEALMRERGYGHVLDSWEGEIERVKAFRFA
jgi:hypothetical protein